MMDSHTQSVTCHCILPDGRIVSGSLDKTLRVWDAATGACERVLEGHSSDVSRVCVLPDGRIVSGSRDKTLRVWNAATGACFQPPTCFLPMILSKDRTTCICPASDITHMDYWGGFRVINGMWCAHPSSQPFILVLYWFSFVLD